MADSDSTSSYSHTIRLLRPVAIYALLDVTGSVRWIGKSTNLGKRLKQHMADKPWIVSCPIIDWADELDWIECEKRWIAYGRAAGWPLENKASGGQGGGGYKHTAETRARISAAKRGKANKPEAFVKAWITRRVNGRDRQSMETIEKRRSKNVGQKRSLAARKRIGDGIAGSLADPVKRLAMSLRMKDWWASQTADTRARIAAATAATQFPFQKRKEK